MFIFSSQNSKSSSKVIALTQLAHLVTPDLSPTKQFEELAVGDIIDKAEVISFEKPMDVYFKLGDMVKCLISGSLIVVRYMSYGNAHGISCDVMYFCYLLTFGTFVIVLLLNLLFSNNLYI